MENSFTNKNLTKLKTETLDWNLVQTEMKRKLGSEVYESWLKKINFIEEFNNYILLSVPTRFIRDWITSRYLDQILQILKNYKKDLIRIEFKIIEQDVQKSAMNARKQNSSFFDNIISDKKITSKIPVNKLKKLFDFGYHKKKINIIFKRSLKKM